MQNEMKKYFTLCAVAIAAIACQKQDALVSPELIDVDLQIGVPTKTAIDANGGMTWKSFDKLSVFSDTDAADGQTNYQFTVKELSSDSESAVFGGSVASNEQRTAVYAFYPYIAKYTGTKLTGVTISYDITDTWLHARLLMAGKGSVAGNDFDNASVEMKQLTWLWDITIENTSDMAITSVALKAAEKIFPYIGDLDLSAEEIAVDPSTYQYRQTLTYMFSSPKAGEDVVARFPIFPMEANGDADLDVIVTFEDGTKEVFSRKAPAKATEAGKRYHNTYTIGEGEYDHMPEGYTLVTKDKASNLGTIIKNQLADESVSEVKIYLESHPSEAIAYTIGANRIYPTKSLYIKSNPEHVKPILSSTAGATFEINSDVTLPVISLRNVQFKANVGSNPIFLTMTATNATLGMLEVDNCVFVDYTSSFLSTTAKNSYAVGNVVLNNSILRWKNTSGSTALFHIPNNSDKVQNITITNSTIEGAIYLVYCNMSSSSNTSFNLVVNNNTFVNSCGSNDGYFISVGSSQLNGSVEVKYNLFGGTFNQEKYNMLRVGYSSPSEKIIPVYSNNYATSDWKSFTHSGKNGSVDILEVTSTNAEVFTDLANFDLTLKSGTTAYGNNVGDPRWLSGSSAGLGDLEIEDTEY